MSFEILEMPEFRVAYCRHIGAPWLCEPAWISLTDWLKKNNLFDLGWDYIGYNLDDPHSTPLEKCRYDACIALPKDYKFSPENNLLEQTIKGGRHLVYKLHANMQEIGQAFTDLHKYIIDNKLEMTGAPYEYYIGAMQADDEGKFQYWLCAPIK